MNPAVVNQFSDSLPLAFAAGDGDVTAKRLEANHVQLLTDLYRAVGRGDLAAVRNSLAEDIEMVILGPPENPWVGQWQGRDAVFAALGRNLSSIESRNLEVLTTVAQGDTVVIFAREQGVYLPTGRPYDVHWVQFFTYRDGKLSRFRELFDSAALVQVFEG